MSIELDAQVRNVALYLCAFPFWNTLQHRDETLRIGKSLMFENSELWFDVPSPTKAMGQEENGNCFAFPASRAGLFNNNQSRTLNGRRPVNVLRPPVGKPTDHLVIFSGGERLAVII